jgi:cytoskeletal protein CcmA (bactofilin family)
MFKGKKASINPNTTDTLIGEGSVFEGRIRSEASIRIEGQITGDIECTGDVTVGEKGIVKSNISARDVIIAGSVHGNVVTKGKLTITSTGALHGNTSAVAFIIDEGGIFQGSSKMETKVGIGAAAPKDPEQDNGNKPYSTPTGGYNGNSVAL